MQTGVLIHVKLKKYGTNLLKMMKKINANSQNCKNYLL